MIAALRCLFWLRPVLLAGVAVFLSVGAYSSSTPAVAQSLENVVTIEPFGLRVAPGDSFEVAVETHPPEQSVAAWVVELAFDPAFVTAESEDCLPFPTPPGAVAASGCEVVDTDGDGSVDTAKMFGAVLFSQTELGLQEEAALANITFTMAEGATTCSFLRLRIVIHADAEGEETGARVRDARVCADVAAPEGGTPEATEIPIRTSEPPPEGGATIPPLDGGQGSDDGGDDGGGGDNGAGGGVGAGQDTGGTTATGAAFGTSPGSSPANGDTDDGNDEGSAGDSSGESGDDGGGVSTAVWAVLGILALGTVGGVAWWMVRMRGHSPQGGGEVS